MMAKILMYDQTIFEVFFKVKWINDKKATEKNLV